MDTSQQPHLIKIFHIVFHVSLNILLFIHSLYFWQTLPKNIEHLPLLSRKVKSSVLLHPVPISHSELLRVISLIVKS